MYNTLNSGQIHKTQGKKVSFRETPSIEGLLRPNAFFSIFFIKIKVLMIKFTNTHQNNTIFRSNIYIRLINDYLPHDRKVSSAYLLYLVRLALAHIIDPGQWFSAQIIFQSGVSFRKGKNLLVHVSEFFLPSMLTR